MDQTIAEYGICTGYDHYELAGIVNDQIKEGWQPWGSPFTTAQLNVLFLHQSMVMYNVKKKIK